MSIAFGIKDLIDILVIALLLYWLHRMLKNTGGNRVFVGLVIFIVIWFLVTSVIRLPLTGAILDKIVDVGVIVLVVIFQNEIRKFFQTLGSNRLWRFFKQVTDRMSRRKEASAEKTASIPMVHLVTACRRLSQGKVGALIVIERGDSLQQYIETGDVFTADISSRLVENIFFKNSPLHDGAMIIRRDHIVAAGAILPVSNNPDIPRHLGLRHRAAMGMSEVTDALIVIVSEETGNISTAMNGKYTLNVSPEQLQCIIAENL